MKKAKKSPGRPKGAINKKRQELIDKAEAMGIDPFEIMLLFAGNKWKELGYRTESKTRFSADGSPYEVDRIEVSDRIHAAKEVCQYIHPKRRSIDLQTENPFLSGEKLVVDLRWADEDHDEDEEANTSPKEG